MRTVDTQTKSSNIQKNRFLEKKSKQQPKSIPITVVVLTFNNENRLGKTLESLKKFDEVLIADTGSKDRTIEIATSYPNVRVESIPFLGFGKTRNLATLKAKHDFVFHVDSDEIVSFNLTEEIFSLKLDPNAIYRIERKNILFNKEPKGAGWHKDRVLRLFHRKTTAFKELKVHESVDLVGTIIDLKNPILHEPYLSISDFLKKMELYSSLFAEQNPHKKASFMKALIRSKWAFIKSYLFRLGIFDGMTGYLIAKYNSDTTFYKYLKLIEQKNNHESN